MYHKGIVMEIKNKYCLVLDEDGTIVRLVLKDKVKVSEKIYYFDEDIYEEDLVVDHRSWVMNPLLKKAVITAMAIFILVSMGLYTTLLHPDTAYATVSFDADKSLQLVVDDRYKIKEAISYDKTISQKELDALLNKNLKDIKGTIKSLYTSDQMLIIGFALFDQKDQKQPIETLLQSLFGKDNVIYVNGEQADIVKAEERAESIGEYTLSDADYDEIEDVIEHLQADEVQDFINQHGELIKDEEIKEEIDDRIEDLHEDDEEEDEDDDNEDDDNEDDADDEDD